eukprot:TRINITY_DN11020_c0_g1_i1.p1 TRINITY_DN11020_c0_g1~~TRINITY_DN11020_c0_g1_i1.p1  ORF type:complete len:609 (-),score=131.88 TRINITY_DN11020_c0_g1_i1:623-2449(-)
MEVSIQPPASPISVQPGLAAAFPAGVPQSAQALDGRGLEHVAAGGAAADEPTSSPEMSMPATYTGSPVGPVSWQLKEKASLMPEWVWTPAPPGNFLPPLVAQGSLTVGATYDYHTGYVKCDGVLQPTDEQADIAIESSFGYVSSIAPDLYHTFMQIRATRDFAQAIALAPVEEVDPRPQLNEEVARRILGVLKLASSIHGGVQKLVRRLEEFEKLSQDDFRRVIRRELRINPNRLTDDDIEEFSAAFEDAETGPGTLNVEEVTDFLENGHTLFTPNGEDDPILAGEAGKGKKDTKKGHGVSPELVRRLQQLFKAATYGTSLVKFLRKFDKDRSGTLGMEELRKIVRQQLRIKPEALSDEDIGVLASALENGSGELSIEDLAEFIEQGSTVGVEDAMGEAEDKDGVLEGDESGGLMGWRESSRQMRRGARKAKKDSEDWREDGGASGGVDGGSPSKPASAPQSTGGSTAQRPGTSQTGCGQTVRPHSWQGQLLFPCLNSENGGLLRTPGRGPPKSSRSARTVEVPGSRGVAGGIVLPAPSVMGVGDQAIRPATAPVDALSMPPLLGSARGGLRSRQMQPNDSAAESLTFRSPRPGTHQHRRRHQPAYAL